MNMLYNVKYEIKIIISVEINVCRLKGPNMIEIYVLFYPFLLQIHFKDFTSVTLIESSLKYLM
jgi:hypothetical protein